MNAPQIGPRLACVAGDAEREGRREIRQRECEG